ncbi:macro domain-containing protein [Flavivirga algicola]|nr:macro domain-containing protein [Flavivirga algicola]
MEIKYIKGDATQPNCDGNKIIVHICNDIGGWGKGFVMAISSRWSLPEASYRAWHKSQNNFELGNVQFVQVENDLWVANIIGQHKIKKDERGNPPIRYEAVETGIKEVLKKAKDLGASVHMPRIGCGLAGGKWQKIEPILLYNLVNKGIKTVVYDFE